MKRRTVSILLTLCMALTLLPGTVLAAEESTQIEEQSQTEQKQGSVSGNNSELAVIQENKTTDNDVMVSENEVTQKSDLETSPDAEIEEDVPAAFSFERSGG